MPYNAMMSREHAQPDGAPGTTAVAPRLDGAPAANPATAERSTAGEAPGRAGMPHSAGGAPAAPLTPATSPAEAEPGWLSLPAMRFPNAYTWFVFFSALDIMLTWAILQRGGREVNPIADRVIDMWGLPGAILFKFGLTILVVIACEVTARKKPRMGFGLAIIAMCVSAVPVFYSLMLLLLHTIESVD